MDHETRFGALHAEWEQICARASREVHEVWEHALATLAQEEAELRAAGRWVRGPADVFGVLGISRAEVRHTRFIAWLMDPAGRHGLGTRFLERALGQTFPWEEFPGLETAIPSCEVVRAECRADIVVRSRAFTIVIEAKVDALEGRDQCNYLFEQFSGDVGARFVFLTPRGRAPTSATGEAKEAFRTLSFAALRDDLRAALAEGGDGDGRAAALEYLRTLEREFPWPA